MFELGYGTLALLTFLAITVLILTRMPVALVFMTIGVFGCAFLLPKPMLSEIPPAMWRMLDSFPLTSVVLFVLMGEFMMHGGLSEELYNATEKWIHRIPGGLAQVNVVACSIFAAISGSSVSCAATMGVIAGPEMERRGYDNRLTYGSLAGGGTLGILIPPSIPMILYGALTGTSVGKLFMAGFVPGIVTTAMFMAVTALWVLKSPGISPRIEATLSWRVKFQALWGFLPTALIILAVLGGIYGGIVTPTEAACVGAVASFVILLAKRRVTRSLLKKSLLSTIVVSSMSYMILAGSALINFLFTYLSVPKLISQAVVNLSLTPLNVFILICLMYIVLGMFIDGISMVVLTVPTVVPLLTSLGFDPIWVCVVLVLLVEIALVTPPVGVNLYVLQGVAQEASFAQIAMGSLPYIGVLLFMVAVLYIFPRLALWLPSTM
jgi:tripartite ATP-independent transporter DctM subunit